MLLSARHKIGLTRLALVTGLDRTGIHVAAAYRPNSRSVCVNHGKGHSDEAAKMSALGEAVELFHAESPDLPTIDAPYPSVHAQGRTAPIHSLSLRVGAETDTDRPIRWVQGMGLADQLPINVPFASICMDLSGHEMPGSDLFSASSTGLGTGPDTQSAILHGLCEVIERDAHALWLLRGNTLANVTVVDSNRECGPSIDPLIQKVTAAGLTMGLADITSDIGVPAILAAVLEPKSQSPHGVPFAIGTACHPDISVAVQKAILEAAQMRLLQITAVRDDLLRGDYGGGNRDIWKRAVQSFGTDDEAFRVPTSQESHDTGEHLKSVTTALAEARQSQPILVDLTRQNLQIPVVKLLIPGLEDGLDPSTQRLGQRGLQAKMEARQ